MGTMTALGGTLRAIPLLAELPEDEIRRLEAATRARRVAPGTMVLDHLDSSTAVYFVIEGAIEVSIHARSGREVTYRTMRAPAYFGELAALDGLPRSAGITAIEPTVIASLAADEFRALLLRRGDIALRLLEDMSARVRDLTERVFEMSTLPVRYRIVAELLRMADANGIRVGRARIDRPPTHMQIATRISTHREAVTRELRSLARAGLLERDGRAMVIPDVGALRDRLAEAAGPRV